MRRLSAFWKALDDIPGAATDALDWRNRLGDEFELARRYLRTSGKLAREVDCPSPGGEGCPRRVVRTPDFGWRAVCGSRGSRCAALDLTQDDIAILALDRARLVADLARVFALTAVPATPGSGRVIELGTHAIAEGVGSRAFLLLPGPQDALTIDELQAAGVPASGAVLIFPRRASLPGALQGRLAALGHHLAHLCEVTSVGLDGELALVQPIEVLFHPVRERLKGQLAVKAGGPVIVLPPGTKWEQITLTFTADETVVVSAPGVIARQVDPGQMQMRSTKNAKPTIAWITLRSMLELRGKLRCARPEDELRVRKQKQVLSMRLQEVFGLSEDPLPWSNTDRAYVIRFVLRDERPAAIRQLGGRR